MKHRFSVVPNTRLERLLQFTFNGKVATVSSPRLEIRFFFAGRGQFNIKVRRAAGDKWLPLSALLPEMELEQLRNAPLSAVAEFLDAHWAALTSSLGCGD